MEPCGARTGQGRLIQHVGMGQGNYLVGRGWSTYDPTLPLPLLSLTKIPATSFSIPYIHNYPSLHSSSQILHSSNSYTHQHVQLSLSLKRKVGGFKSQTHQNSSSPKKNPLLSCLKDIVYTGISNYVSI